MPSTAIRTYGFLWLLCPCAHSHTDEHDRWPGGRHWPLQWHTPGRCTPSEVTGLMEGRTWLTLGTEDLHATWPKKNCEYIYSTLVTLDLFQEYPGILFSAKLSSLWALNCFLKKQKYNCTLYLLFLTQKSWLLMTWFFVSWYWSHNCRMLCYVERWKYQHKNFKQ